MANKELLFISGRDKISLVNINEHKIVRVIEVPGANYIFGVCKINQNMVLAGGKNNLFQWDIRDDNLILFSKKENAHNSYINVLCNLGDGHIASGCEDSTIKIW